MIVLRRLAHHEGMKLLPAGCAEGIAAEADRNASAQVRQREVRLPVAAVHRAEQREQRLILVNGQELAVALRPALRRKIKSKYLNLAHERRAHRDDPLNASGTGREDTLQGDAEVQC